MTITRSKLHRSKLHLIAAKWAAAGVAPGPMDRLLEDTNTAEQRLRDSHAAAVALAGAETRSAPDRLVADPTPQLFAEIADEIAGHAARVAHAKDLLVRSVARVYAQAHATLAAVWVDVDAQLIATHDEMMAELAKLAPKLDGITTDTDAVKAGQPVAGTWAKAAELADRRTAMIALRFEVAGVLGLADYDPTDDLRQYRHPENLRDWPARAVDAPRHRVTRLLDDVDAGAEPALCTDAEVASASASLGTTRPARVHPFGRNHMAERDLATVGQYPQD